MKINKKLSVLVLGTLMATAVIAFAGEIVYTDYKKTVFKSGLIIKVDDDRPGVVEEVVVKTGEVKTSAGIALGMSVDKLNEVYGKADKVDIDRQDTEYKYFTTDGTKEIEFKVKDGVITKISCELRH